MPKSRRARRRAGRPAGLILALAAHAALAALAAPRHAMAQDAAPALAPHVVASIDSLFSRWSRPGSPGCVLGVLQDGWLVHARGYGAANLDHDLPLTPRSVFYIASVSKQFTAAAAVLLEQEGRLSLDDDVRAYIPELPDYGVPITIRHLLHHTSGVRDYLTLMDLAGMRLEDVHPDDEVLELVVRQRALNFAPGERHLYSNSGYFLISVIVQRVTGQSLREYADERIFRPLGMRDTHFHDDHTMVVPRRAMAYAPGRSGGFRQNYWSNFDKVGSGGLLTTVEDLALWDRNYDEPRVGGDMLLERLHTRGVLNDGDTLDYALGLRLGEYRGLRMVGHGGSSMGFRTNYVRFPDAGVTVICLCNVSAADAGGLSRAVADIVLADRFPEPLRRDVAAGGAGAGTGEGDVADPPARPVAELAAFAGLYATAELGVSYRITLDGEALTLRRPADPPAPLRALGTNAFRAGNLVLEFIRDQDGAVTGFTLDAGRATGVRFDRES